ncbi:LysR family transcriptional regulator ArgP [Nocardioides perillae]|uniref:LysR family transcriptional regulator (Chromosome initiation inhibitor) n=1 Tax=Nocardioides perillae TaxID=1119534 RepID=A0A7Y9RV25_9ACTN|nr:LysR family transcriptional regulator ArgP [Nocardioides perillae]NYG54470.1 LysR family transcriptional regulator (chromosome initiation inhibitor) [Nocardioides perillae]
MRDHDPSTVAPDALPAHQLAALVAVVDTGTFEAAARALHVTPSAVSQRVRALESAVGRVLVRRSTPCAPTGAGEVLVRLGRAHALLQAEAYAALDGAASGVLELGVAVNADSLATWFPLVVAGLAEWEGLALTVRVQDQERTADLLRSGAVLAAVTAEPAAVQGCSVEPLGSLRYRAAAAPHLLERHRHGGRLRWADLPLVAFDETDDLQHRMLAARGHAEARVVHRVPTTEGFLAAVTAGLGWGLVPEPQLAPLVAAGRLVEVGPRERVDVALHWQRWRLTSPVLDRLTGLVREAARAHLRRR